MPDAAGTVTLGRAGRAMRPLQGDVGAKYSSPARWTGGGKTWTLSQPAFARRPRFSARAAHGHGGRILVVDDDANVRLMFRAALETAGHVVADAPDARGGLARLCEFPAQLVLVDLCMPGMSGIDMLTCLRNQGNDVPAIVVTGRLNIPHLVAAMRLASFHFLVKPLTPQRLCSVVADLLCRGALSGTCDLALPLGPPVLDLAQVTRAVRDGQMARAARLLRQAIELAPGCAPAHNLLGLLHEAAGADHHAYHCYKCALQADRRFAPALENMRRYCQRYGLDFNNPIINPGAVGD